MTLKPTDRLLLALMRLAGRPLTPAELLDRSACSPYTLTRALTKLRRDNWIIRVQTPAGQTYALPPMDAPADRTPGAHLADGQVAR